MSSRVEPGSIILTPQDARMLYQAARIGELRKRHRVGNTALYQLLTDISVCAFTGPPTEPGNHPRQNTASEERETWTVNQLARATGLSQRAIRLDCQHNVLPATRHGHAWSVAADDATVYIKNRRR